MVAKKWNYKEHAWNPVGYVSPGSARLYLDAFKTRYPEVAARCEAYLQDVIKILSTPCSCMQDVYP